MSRYRYYRIKEECLSSLNVLNLDHWSGRSLLHCYVSAYEKTDAQSIMAAILTALMAAALALANIENPSILPTPLLGFNNWARFECGLNQSLLVETADATVSKGLLAAGYDRINLDDCWMQHTRASSGSLQWNTTMFPNGLIWLGEYVKSKGIHFGIYEDSGNGTCGGYPGTRGHEKLDAEIFESWVSTISNWTAATYFPRQKRLTKGCSPSGMKS